ncbi:hypothetical protein F5Y18DRAFT_405094 [Xylariaceae sp. FL1019]|nr:hypothetical protein F5Y18DRAFT_405094 [Xylariaceae sp. FL1019]
MSSYFPVAKPKRPGAKGMQIRPTGSRIQEVLQRSRAQSERAMSVEPSSATANTASTARSAKKDRPSCPNPRCPNPSAPVQDGFCSSCGREIDASNIVAEVQFGETSSGAAMVQGSFLAADQGTSRSLGPGMRRMGGLAGDNREKTIRDAKNRMYGFKSRLQSISESSVECAVMIFKLALGVNWLQGRGMDKVVPVCLYTACRRDARCDLMLIDFAEVSQINVFELGHVFKDLSNVYSFQNGEVKSVIPENLMMRFAEKLDFGEFTHKVAADAARLCRRMAKDWMVIGRRPSGVCGACLLMAARMWNFRRTVKEIVYVVKVTSHTIMQRLDEFTVTESSNLSIEQFLTQEFLESAHNPPSFYRQTLEWKEKMAKESGGSGRKRRRELADIGEEGMDEDEPEAGTPGRIASASSLMLPPPRPVPAANLSKVEHKVKEFLPVAFDKVEGRDVITPFDPEQIPQIPPLRSLRSEGRSEGRPEAQPEGQPPDVMLGLMSEDPTSEQAVNGLQHIYGPSGANVGEEEEMIDVDNYEEEEVEEDANEELDATEAQPQTGRGKKGQPAEPDIRFDEEWEKDEKLLGDQIDEIISDPHSSVHTKALATAAHIAHIKAEWARSLLPNRVLKMDAIVGEDEFADDPEVQFCELAPAEVKVKEEIWLNANRDWIRKQQEKEYRKQMEALGPPKRKRNRQKKPRMGEGQLTPASSPSEAAIEVMKKRNIVSKRINYDAIHKLFDKDKRRGPGSVVSRMESDTGSRRMSRLGSVSSIGSPAPRTSVEKSPFPKPAEEHPDDDEQPEEGEDEYLEQEYDEEDTGWEFGAGNDNDDGEGEVYD